MNKIIQFLIAAKILDEDKTLSHTSLLLSTAIVRLAFFPADAYTVAILTLAITHANAKRFSAHKRTAAATAATHKNADRETASQNQLAITQSEIDSIKSELKQVIQIINLRGK